MTLKSSLSLSYTWRYCIRIIRIHSCITQWGMISFSIVQWGGKTASNTSAVHLKQWVAAHSSKLWSGIIKPTLSVSSKTREKHIWQKRRENGGGLIERMKKMEADGRGEDRGREEMGVIMITSLMLAKYSGGIFQTKILTWPSGEDWNLSLPPPCSSSLLVRNFQISRMNILLEHFKGNQMHRTDLIFLYAGILALSIFACILAHSTTLYIYYV